MRDSPHAPITDLTAGAAQAHELYSSYVEAGFTEDQALRITIGILTAGIAGGGQ
ncbi:hypothetical protein [Streptomyces carpinensis]|uniref:Uncharacterized protein n=1 Tax=Streptomyces carpinensis TaxID=66369 RepID=A0ABV1W7Q4_9ACTN|nr:hypothetical protein [Streptomyces carpinensis]